MALIDNLLGKLIRKGTLTVVMPDGKARSFGPGGEPAMTVNVADRRTAALRSHAEALQAKLDGGEALAEIAASIGAEVEQAEQVGRAAAAPEQALVAEVFRMPRPAADAPVRRLVAPLGRDRCCRHGPLLDVLPLHGGSRTRGVARGRNGYLRQS